mgnify:CR=1 FL=1
MEKINYYVIGGQYEYICYGGTMSLGGVHYNAGRFGTTGVAGTCRLSTVPRTRLRLSLATRSPRQTACLSASRDSTRCRCG